MRDVVPASGAEAEGEGAEEAPSEASQPVDLARNYGWCAVAGVTWYLQFFFCESAVPALPKIWALLGLVARGRNKTQLLKPWPKEPCVEQLRSSVPRAMQPNAA